ncbi:MAG: ferrous iron transporter B [Oscillospiraceae bacterium]|nr:ferrous iron transporter B [Oscillospiraceae bacterium]
MEIKIALAGNPNCGKTTLFNALTGSNQFVGNWPGVTVEKKEGKLKGHKDVVITDLPGVYSLSPYTLEEVVARNYLVGERPDAILNIIDGTNLERNLYLTTQLIELGIPVVCAVNMMDVVRKNGDKINIAQLSKELGCKVVEISALKNDGIKEAAEVAVEVAKQSEPCVPNHKFGGCVEHAIAHIEEAVLHDIPDEQQRWYAIKIFERDEKVLEMLNLSQDKLEHMEKDIQQAETEMDDDAESIITNERYIYIASVIKGCLKKKNKGGLTTSDKIDKIVTNRFLALPIFAVIMFVVYYISVTTVGTWVTDWTNDGLFGDGFHLFNIGVSDHADAVDAYASENVFTDELLAMAQAAADADVVGAEDVLGAVEEADFGAFEEAYGSYGDSLAEAGFNMGAIVDEPMEGAPAAEDYGVWVPGVPVLAESGLDAVGCDGWLKSLILDGIVAGVGAVLGFVPQMLVLFILLAFLESCGYMARIAFVMDRIFRKFGLSGKSFIPMLIGVGCGVPGVMASRTIENERDRRMTIMTTTFIPCGAKMPIVALIAGSLFGNAWWVAPSAFFVGCAAIVISGIMLKKTKMFAGDPAPFVMELPAYHLPTISNLLRSMWERGWSFIKKAGTIILLSTIIIWAGSCFGNLPDGGFGFSTELEMADSVLGMIGSAICWLFAPLGFGDPTAAVATVMGLVAKEEVVAVFGVLDFMGMTKLAGYSFLVFNLLCAPCFAAMGAIRREMNNPKWTGFAIAYQCVFAYAVSLVIYQLGLLFTGAVNVIGLIIALAVIAAIIYMLIKPYKESTKLEKEVKVSKKEKANV